MLEEKVTGNLPRTGVEVQKLLIKRKLNDYMATLLETATAVRNTPNDDDWINQLKKQRAEFDELIKAIDAL